MDKRIFKFIRETGIGENCGKNAIAHVVGKLQVPESKSDKLIPSGNNTIDVVKDFKWTKTRRNTEGRENVPTLELEEYYVAVPAFFANMRVAEQILKVGGAAIVGALGGIGELAGLPGSVTNLLSNALDAVHKSADEILNQVGAGFGANEVLDVSSTKYLTAYDKLYGVVRSEFIYKLPYLDDKYKSISSSWAGGGEQAKAFTGGLQDKITDAFTMFAPGVGIDYAKSFTYPETGPSHNIRFYLDNTIDYEYDTLKTGADPGDITKHIVIPNYETNFRLVYLLLYQNLPNRLNKIAFVPPVIYRAKVPGMFSYRYSYISNITVNMIGVRKNKRIEGFIETEGDTETGTGRGIDVVIPEAYEIGLTITSLLPESKNLYFDAINNPVVSDVSYKIKPVLTSRNI